LFPHRAADRLTLKDVPSKVSSEELVGFQTGVRESAQSWRELLVDIKQRGLEIAPDLAVGDGVLGFWKAIEEVFQGTRH
jgi:transposase-like protein